MRVSKEQAAQNRQHILTAATRLFREHGIHATGVDAITKEAGLTHGSLYSQFGSKEAIAVEAIHFAVTRSKHLWRRAAERQRRWFSFSWPHLLSAPASWLGHFASIVSRQGQAIRARRRRL